MIILKKVLVLAKVFILATSLNVIHNYFVNLKLFSGLAKFLNISEKPFFPCTFDF